MAIKLPARAGQTGFDYWTAARAARSQGRIAQALDFYVRATAFIPVGNDLAHEAGMFALDVNRNLAALEEIYDRHRRSFGLSVEECPVRVPGTKIGTEGITFGIDCLLTASARGGVPGEWYESLADALERSGQPHQALQWRRVLSRRETMRRVNRLAIARLHEELGSLHDAAKEYDEMLDMWPDDPEVEMGMRWLRERRPQPLQDAVPIDPLEWVQNPRPTADAETPERAAGRVLHVVWAAVKRGAKRLPSGAREQLGRMERALSARYATHPTCQIIEGYLALLDGNTITARKKFLMASVGLASGRSLASNTPSYDAALHDAMHWARIVLLNPDAYPHDGALPPIDAAALERAHAHYLWTAGDIIAAMNRYAGVLRPYHVSNPALHYDIRGGYKILFHEGLFYAVPRTVSEFTIIDGKVFRLAGHARGSRQLLPPWLIDLAYRIAGAVRAAGRIGPLRMLSRPVARLGRFLRRKVSHPLAVRATRLVWSFYRVKGVLVAEKYDRLIELVSLADGNQAFKTPERKR